MRNTLTPAAQSSYDAYVNHVKQCTECHQGAGRCRQAVALVQIYLTSFRRR